eukprot:scaffold120686_cov63-Phaeocystis_antarctica.AAC.2
MALVRGIDRACGAAVGVRSLQIRRITRACGPPDPKLSAPPEVISSVLIFFAAQPVVAPKALFIGVCICLPWGRGAIS